MTMDLNLQRIVFFDGVCGLCNKAVDWFMKRDKNRVLRYSPLQGEAAARLLPANDLSDLKTIIYWREGKIYRRSDAIFQMLKDIGRGWNSLYALMIIPRFVRDRVYDWVSRNRYQWFGKKDSCRLPTREERQRFLP